MIYWERILWSDKLGPSKFPWPCPLTKVIGPMGWKASQNIDSLLASVSSSNSGWGSWSPKRLRIFVPTTDLLGSNVLPSELPVWGPYLHPSRTCHLLLSQQPPSTFLGFTMRNPNGWDQALVTAPGRGTEEAGKHPPQVNALLSLPHILGLQQDNLGLGKKERKPEQMRTWRIICITSSLCLSRGRWFIPDGETEAWVTVWDLTAAWGWLCSRWASLSRIGRISQRDPGFCGPGCESTLSWTCCVPLSKPHPKWKPLPQHLRPWVIIPTSEEHPGVGLKALYKL